MFGTQLKDHSDPTSTGIFDNHCRADVLRTRYNDFDTRFKFCFVRNPWERCLSWYNYHSKLKDLKEYECTFEEWVLRGCKHHWGRQNGTRYKAQNISPLEQHQFIYDNSGNLLVDFIGRVETFDADILEICSIVNVKVDRIQHRNSTHKSSDWKKIYTEKMKNKVSELFQKDIALFNYEF
jgi:hypothetical protein